MCPDAHVVNHIDDIFNLLRVDDVIGQMIIHFRVSQVALLLASGNKFFQLLGWFGTTYHCAFFPQDELSST